MTKTVNGIDGSQLKSLIERIETLETEKKNIADDIKEVFAEAKTFGYDVKIIKEVLKLRKLEEADLYELETMLDIYKSALGMEESEAQTKEQEVA